MLSSQAGIAGQLSDVKALENRTDLLCMLCKHCQGVLDACAIASSMNCSCLLDRACS